MQNYPWNSHFQFSYTLLCKSGKKTMPASVYPLPPDNAPNLQARQIPLCSRPCCLASRKLLLG
jgi:hypothetical protein